MTDTIFQVIFAVLVAGSVAVVALVVLRVWQQSRDVAAPVPVRTSDAVGLAAAFGAAMLVTRWMSQGWSAVDLDSILLFGAVVGLVAGAAELWVIGRGHRRLAYFVEVAAVAYGVLGGLSGVS